jgi:hypothetical protein
MCEQQEQDALQALAYQLELEQRQFLEETSDDNESNRNT